MSVGESTIELRERQQAVAELGAALRELNEAVVSTEVDANTLLRTAEQARALVGPLAAAARTRTQRPSVDGGEPATPMYNPVSGAGNPIAPPMDVEVIDGAAVGTCTLGLGYEGPPSYGHGGISALLIDQILGYAFALSGRPGMTTKLSVRYRQPVPLRTPLRITGRVHEDNSGQTHATITTVDDPDTVLVRAEGTFVTPSAAQVERLFGDFADFIEERTVAVE